MLSPLAAEATGLRHGQEVWIARSAQEWISGVEQLCGHDGFWRRLSAAAHALARSQYGYEQGLALMRQAFEKLGLEVPA